jgi:hypothetical protein
MNDVSTSFSSLSTRTSIFDLPEEIIILILQYLRPEQPLTTFPPRLPSSSSYTVLCQSWTNATPPPWPIPAVPRSLVAFARVSKRANQLVKPLLYNAIALQTIDITDQLALQLIRDPSSGSLIKHLFIPHDGLMHSPSDRLASLETWPTSWRCILAAATRLESLFLLTRPGGKALEQLLDHTASFKKGMSSLRRLTISSLSFTQPTLTRPIHAPCLTHLHLIQDTTSTLTHLLEPTTHQSLQYLRLSRVSPVPFRYFSDMFRQGGGGRKEIFNSAYARLQPLVALLRECIEECPRLQVITLEINEEASLETPDGLMALNEEHETESNLDEEVLEWPVEGAENREAHWSRVSDAKRLLSQCSQEVRDSHIAPIDFRIVAPRPGGWDRNECLIDFHANSAACRCEVDRSAFMDEDVFELVKKHPRLGYDYGIDSSGKRRPYWTGSLPKV